MKKTFVALLLIALISGQEIQDFERKLEEKELKKKDHPRLLEAISVTTIVISTVIGVTITYILNTVYDKIKYELTNSNTVDTYNEDGKGRWLSNIEDGYVMSAYYHKTKRHSATCNGGFLGGGQIRAEAPAGSWAIALCKAGISGRKTYWNTLE